MTPDEAMKIDEARKIRDEAERHLRAAQQALDAAERQGRLDRQRALRPVADLAHRLFCTYNHTDGCGWSYEEHPNPDVLWEGSDHRRWLAKIERVCDDTLISTDLMLTMLTEYSALVASNPKFNRLLFAMRMG